MNLILRPALALLTLFSVVAVDKATETPAKSEEHKIQVHEEVHNRKYHKMQFKYVINDVIDYKALQPDIYAELIGKKIPSLGWLLQDAKCETGINWKNGGKYAGAFGIYIGSWLQWGGGYLAPTPDQATPEEQILVIIRITTTGWRFFDKYVPPAGFMMNSCFRPLTWTVYEG